MNRFRTVLFWMHLTAGSLVGTVILVMCLTGVALTCEKQLLEWADSRSWSATLPAGSSHLSPETLLAKVTDAQPGAAPTGLSLRADKTAPATVTLEGNATLLVDPYTGTVIGPPPQGLRAFFRTVTSWHRYLALEGERRATGRMFTGAANVAFLFIVISGVYLWIPRTLSWFQVGRVVWFRRGLKPKARDFNWHNVFGFWCAIPLVVVVSGAIPISYAWGTALVYRLVGEQPPAGTSRPGPSREAGAESLRHDGLDRAWARATSEIPSWRTIAVRLSPNAQAPWALTVDSGFAGQPQNRYTLTIDRSSGVVLKSEGFENFTLGRRARSWLRFAHTGEFYGVTGQTIAGVASAGGAVLVYTGLSLALRRFLSGIRRDTDSARAERKAA